MSPTPRLRSDLVVVEQTYRGEQTYIVKDPTTHKYFRFRPIEVVVMQSLDGERTIAAAAAALSEEGIPVSESALAGFAHSLTKMGLIERSVGERSVLELERLRAERRARRRPQLFRGSLMRMRWSVGDPNAALDRWMPQLEFFFSPAFFVISAACFLAYVLVLALKWSEFQAGFASLYSPSQLTAGKLAIILFTTVFIIAVHELGHGVTCKHFGGSVHEMGAMLIYLMPAFYCNVNDAWTFPRLSARLWVTAAGSWIQLVLAGLAAVVWWAVAPGTVVSQVALTAVVVGGAMTILSNANPLIPLDGYYALSDWLEITNLRQRALAYAGWLVRRRILRLDVPEPAVAADERRVLIIYGALASAYIGTILSIVALTVYGWARAAFGTAAALALAGAIVLMLRGRLLEIWRLLRATMREHSARWRALRLGPRLLTAAAALLVVAALLPWPITISGPFVASAGRTAALVAPEAAVISQILVREGMRVAAGAPVARLRSLEIEREAIGAARVADSLRRRADVARAGGDAGRAATLEAQSRSAAALASGLAARTQALTLRALTDGVVLTPRPHELVGRHVDAGDVVLTTAAAPQVEARVQLGTAGATLVRPGQPARLVLHDGRYGRGVVQSVAPASADGSAEARIALADDAWRPGLTGNARITLRKSSVAGAAWWRLRSGIRSDLLF